MAVWFRTLSPLPLLFVAFACSSGHDHDEEIGHADEHSEEGSHSDEDGHEEEHGERPSGATCPSDSVPSYESFGQDFMQNYCSGCHNSALAEGDRQGAPLEHNFETQALIQNQIAAIDAVAAFGPTSANHSMPPSHAQAMPTEEERTQLGQWLACGAP